MTKDEVVGQLLEQVKTWILDPGTTTELKLMVQMKQAPDGSVLRQYLLTATTGLMVANMSVDAPRIVLPNGPLPPGKTH